MLAPFTIFRPGKQNKTGPSGDLSRGQSGGLKNERGQGLIEYLIVVALIAVATIGIMRTVGQAVGTRFASISDAVQGNRKKYAVEAIDENLLRRRDLGDFMNGVGSNGSGSSSGGQ